MDSQKENVKFSLSDELITKITLDNPNLRNATSNIPNLIVDHYEKLYDSIDENWKKTGNSRKLLKTLFSLKKDDAIVFLFNNYKNDSIIYNISYYMGLFNHLELSQYINTIYFEALALGAAENCDLELVKYAVSKGALNFNEIAYNFAFRGNLNGIAIVLND